MLVGWSVPLLALLSLAEAIVSSLESVHGAPPLAVIDDLVVTPELINSLKALEAYWVKMDEERVASFSAGPQLASVSADGSFAFPPNCTPAVRPANYPFCFHGKRGQNGNEKNITAIVDFFDVNDPKDNTVIGFAAEYEGANARDLEAYAGGEAELLFPPWAFSLKTYDVELPQPGMLGTLQNSFVAEPHIKFYIANKNVLDADAGPAPTSYVYAKKSMNVGFNVSAGIERSIPKGSVGASLKLTLNTVKGNDSMWLLDGTGKATFKAFGLIFSRPS
ncbi:hypothetical protein FOZ60_001651 [Perkinsus olseni]|uniref:Uncharacterized protein n=1 Tax=Perkinsus olseni TaxID=32597 RepID=A0A7J6NZZ4_PEROL|nr:hypothetical protein FOZ60_001651 [Perkinsus olseni]